MSHSLQVLQAVSLTALFVGVSHSPQNQQVVRSSWNAVGGVMGAGLGCAVLVVMTLLLPSLSA